LVIPNLRLPNRFNPKSCQVFYQVK